MTLQAQARILALDIGDRRIGVAVSDLTRTIARPVCTVERASREEDFTAIRELVEEYRAGLLLVGLPLTLRGEIGPQARHIQRYTDALAETVPVPIRMWDERYSTSRAEEILRRPGRSAERAGVDAVAAAVFLQEFLDRQAVEGEERV